MSIATTTTTTSGGDYRWQAKAPHVPASSGTLDISAFTEATHYVNGYVPSGTPVAKIAASGLYGPATSGLGAENEVVTLTVGGSGLTSFTLTFGGQTTSSLDDQATAAEVEAALIALSSIDADGVSVGGPAGGPWRVTFHNTHGVTDVGAITTTPTGGSGTVTAAVADAGANGLSGFVAHDVDVNGTNDLPCAIETDVTIDASRLPVDIGLTDGRYICNTEAS